MKSVPNVLVKSLMEKGLTVAFAESITCGLAATQLASYKGVSEVLKGSIACYTPDFKRQVMGVQQCTIDQYTCESMEVTEELALNLSKMVRADIYAAITGLASSGGSESPEKPVGTVFICLHHKSKLYKTQKLFRGSPLQIKKKASKALYDYILSEIC